jgi:hypothetical protein
MRLPPTLIFMSITALFSATLHATSAPVRRALLIGINNYQPAGTTAQHPPDCHSGRCNLPTFNNLEGSLNDVAAMRDLLSSPKYAFDPINITVLTNPGLPKTQLKFNNLAPENTTHTALISMMRKYLVDIPNPGDIVVFYYAGHGSLRVNSRGTKLSMLVQGKPNHADSTLVPSDAYLGADDILDREITKIFNEALNKNIHLIAFFDSCHSGSFTRGVEINPPFTSRSIEYDPRDINKSPETTTPPAEREKNPAIIFSAAQQDQTAKEGSFDVSQNKEHHGAFTLANPHA